MFQKSLQNNPKTTSAVTVIFSALPPSYRTAAAAAAAGPRLRRRPTPPPSPAPCRRRSFPITDAAFGSSWVKKGGGGLGFRSWAILPAPPLIRIYTPALHNYQNTLSHGLSF